MSSDPSNDVMATIPHPDDVFDIEAMKQNDVKNHSSFFAFNRMKHINSQAPPGYI